VTDLGKDTSHHRRIGHLWGLLADDDGRKVGIARHLLEELYVSTESSAEVQEHIIWRSLLSALIQSISSSNILVAWLKNLQGDQLRKAWIFLIRMHLDRRILNVLTLDESISLLILKVP
jgi:hypothetical protein